MTVAQNRHDRGYILRSSTDAPSSIRRLTTNESFSFGLYLPQHASTSFLSSAFRHPLYSAQLLLLFGSWVIIVDLSDRNVQEHWIPFTSIQFVESGNLPFNHWLALVTPASTHNISFASRDQYCVDEFLFEIRKD